MSCVVGVLPVNDVWYHPYVVFASVRLPLYINTQDTQGKMRISVIQYRFSGRTRRILLLSSQTWFQAGPFSERCN